jgi:hypothetical protein
MSRPHKAVFTWRSSATCFRAASLGVGLSGRWIPAVVLYAFEQALHDLPRSTGLVAHSEHGSQGASLRLTTPLADLVVAPSVVSVRDAAIMRWRRA